MKQTKAIRYFWLSAVALTLLAIFISNFWFDSTEELSKSNLKKDGTKYPSAFITRGTYLRYDDNGKLSSKFESQETLFYPDSHTANITSPMITLYKDGVVDWILSAQTGQYDTNTEILTLNKHVFIRQPQATGAALSFKTQFIRFDNKSRFISTDQQVKINFGLNTLNGTGMSFWIETKRLELHGNVKGQYIQGIANESY